MSAQTTIDLNRLCSKPIEASDLSKCTFVLYEPDLTGFDQNVSNWHAGLCSEHDCDTFLPNLAELTTYARRLLATIAHIFLNQEYLAASISTDSATKLLKSVVIDGVVIPRWFIDICRETVRPMVSYHTVFLPVFNLDYDGNSVVPGTGLSPASSFIWTKPFAQNLDPRELIVERLTPAPLFGRVNEGIMCFQEYISDTRYNCCLNLRTLHNGTRAYKASEVKVRKTPRNTPFEFTLSRNDTMQHSIIDRWNLSAPINLEIKDQNELNNFLLTYANGHWVIDHPEIGTPIVVLTFQGDLASTSKWVTNSLSRVLPNAARPPIVEMKDYHLLGLHFSKRFPSDEKHSKSPTPSGKGSQRQSRSNPKKQKSFNKSKITSESSSSSTYDAKSDAT